jgi:eukaryotic-like serine/threonine-protein kinase
LTQPEKLGKYVVEGVLGKGAMGIVYRAHDPHIERTVAIKTVRKDLLDAELAHQFMARFRNEARAAGRLSHPNIVAIYEYGEDEHLAYIAMEYVDGLGLREYLNRKAQFTLGQVASIVTQLLQALAFAHAQGVVHRDVKPANLILTPAGTVKVADFGIARIDATTLTMTGMVMGTPSYMAPEQCRGLPSDARADLFSVGVVLYELLAGRRPFDGSMEAIAYRICHERHRPASEIAPFALPPGIDALLDRALAKDPADRFADARTFEMALRSAVAGEAEAPMGGEATVINLADVPLAIASAAFDDAMLATIERQLVRFVGPMARILVRQAAARAHDAQELRTILGSHIADARERARFETQAQAAVDASGAHAVPTAGRAAPSVAVPKAQPSGTAKVTSSSRSGASRPLEAAFVEQTTSRLAVYLGPIARVVARKAAERARDCEEFVELVAQHIGTQERNAFLRDIGANEK